MFERLDLSPPEPILQIAQDFAKDLRTDKIDLGVGVYRNATGQTPVMDVVKAAERAIVEAQDTKSYCGLLGNVPYNVAVGKLILGDQYKEDGHVAVQTPGGSGALRLLYDLIKLSGDATVWVPDLTWANHLPVLKRAGLKVQTYPYYDATTGGVKFEEMCATLKALGPEDVVLLHGCCHNPTGASLENAHWDIIAELVQQQGFVPLVDLAYQGFGDGLEEDAYGPRRLYAAADEMMLAYSCSKNFAIYRERAGLAMVVSKHADILPRAIGQMKFVARTNYSMPPDHGAETVRTILSDADLATAWRAELEEMRQRVLDIRTSLVDILRAKTDGTRFDFIGRQKGMFSLLGCSREDVVRLRENHAIYMAPDSRVNLAGLSTSQLDTFGTAIAETI